MEPTSSTLGGRYTQSAGMGRIAKFKHVIGSGVMTFVQGGEDVGVTRADEAGSGVHVIDAAVGQADVVGDGVEFAAGDTAADGGFDFVAELGGFFDAGAGFCA